MSKLGSWLSDVFSTNRRRAPRTKSPELRAYFWTGGHAEPHHIRDISASGLFLLTQDHWYPGTMVRLVLQYRDGTEEEESVNFNVDPEIRKIPKNSITVQAIVVHQDDQGVGFGFFLLDDKLVKKRNIPKEGATRKEFEVFLERYLREKDKLAKSS